ncbi:uncharacterized protein ACBR49_017787 [Aulostomus maculatus]
MTEKWWKAFLPSRKKSSNPKETNTSQVFDVDFDPFAQKPEKPKDPTAPSKTTGDQSQQDANNGSCIYSDDTYDDSQLESVFNEQSCRRNMRVSRSGRFKEKRRVRGSLPIEEKGTEQVTSGKEDVR